MTEPTAETADEQPETEEVETEEVEPEAEPQEHSEPGDQATPHSREARYRVERNQARAQVEQLQQQVGRLLRGQVVTEASKAGLAQGGDIFTVGDHKLDDFLDDAGDIDQGKIAAAVRGLLGARPGLRRSTESGGWPGQGRTNPPRSGPRANPLADVVGPNRQRP